MVRISFMAGRETFSGNYYQACWHLPSLKNHPLVAKQTFMAEYKVDFADIIHSVNVPLGSEENVLDTYIDSRIHQPKNIIHLIEGLTKLKAVYFTRKTFTRVPNILNQIIEIRNHCHQNGIRFCLRETTSTILQCC
jgi:hypothetical protein